MSIRLVAAFSLDEIAEHRTALRVPVNPSSFVVVVSSARRRIAELIRRYPSWAEALAHVGDVGSFDAEFLHRAMTALDAEEAQRLDWWWTTFSKPWDSVGSNEDYWFAAVSRIAWRFKRLDRALDSREQRLFEECEELRAFVASEFDRLTAYAARLDSSNASVSDWDREVVRFFAADPTKPSRRGLLAFISNLIVDVSVAHWWARCSGSVQTSIVSDLRREIEDELSRISRPAHLRGEPRSFLLTSGTAP